MPYATTAEVQVQRRGLIHFHAIFPLDRIDAVHPERVLLAALAAESLADVIRDALKVFQRKGRG